ncbi:MAG: hypothetical protein ACI9UA_004576, partial [Pseudoalteromonas tetraodonis]
GSRRNRKIKLVNWVIFNFIGRQFAIKISTLTKRVAIL